MRLFELLPACDIEKIKQHIVECYADQADLLDEYDRVFNCLKSITPVENDTIIIIKIIENDGEIIFDVEGYDKDSDMLLGLTVVSWTEWLGMVASDKTLEEFTCDQILAHVLWEMTFCGFTEDDPKQMAEYISQSYYDFEE